MDAFTDASYQAEDLVLLPIAITLSLVFTTLTFGLTVLVMRSARAESYYSAGTATLHL